MIDHINGEPVELVTDFGALRVLDIVYVVSCSCGRPHHRMALVSWTTAPGYSMYGDERGWWVCEPPARCVLPFVASGGLTGIGPGVVADRRIYRVINPPRAADVDEGITEVIAAARAKKALAR